MAGESANDLGQYPAGAQPAPASAGRMSRRGFLSAAAGAAAAGSLGSVVGALAAAPNGPTATAQRLSRVVRAQSDLVIEGATIRRPVLAEMFERSLLKLTGAGSMKESWRSLLSPRDVIGIKFNRSGQAGLGTTETTAEVLLTSLIESGWSPEQIVCIEAPEGTVSKFGTRPMVEGYAPRETDFGSGADRFASVLDQVTALINVPFLKTHNIATMTCCLKNLSHGLVKHPGRYHANGCSPFIADIAAAAPIRGKLRLNVVDGLRVVCEGGPSVVIGGVRDAGCLLLSIDPVATDLVGLAMLNEIRSREGMSLLRFAATGGSNYLEAASQRGLGRSEWHQIDSLDVVN